MDEVERATRGAAERWFREVWGQRRRASIRELWKAGATCAIEGLPPVTVDDFEAYHDQMLRAFSDFHVEVLGIVVDHDRAAVEWRITGTHDGPFMGIPPSGHSIDETGVTLLIIEDGQLAGGRDSWNLGATLIRLARPSIPTLLARHGVTRRQAEVALLLADHLSTKQIARRLEISVNTARRHVQAVLRRLGVNGRDEVADVIGKVDVAPSGPHSPDGA